jgi:hypothetical protein
MTDWLNEWLIRVNFPTHHNTVNFRRNFTLKIATLQCFYIDQWLRWASARGCLGRTRRGSAAPGRICKYDSPEIRYLKNRTIQLFTRAFSIIFGVFGAEYYIYMCLWMTWNNCWRNYQRIIKKWVFIEVSVCIGLPWDFNILCIICASLQSWSRWLQEIVFTF